VCYHTSERTCLERGALDESSEEYESSLRLILRHKVTSVLDGEEREVLVVVD